MGGSEPTHVHGERTLMKKLLILAAASAAGVALWRKASAGKSADQPWAAATDKP